MGFASLYENISERQSNGIAPARTRTKRPKRSKPKLSTTQPSEISRIRVLHSVPLAWQLKRIADLEKELRKQQILNADLKRALRRSREEAADLRGAKGIAPPSYMKRHKRPHAGLISRSKAR